MTFRWTRFCWLLTGVMLVCGCGGTSQQKPADTSAPASLGAGASASSRPTDLAAAKETEGKESKASSTKDAGDAAATPESAIAAKEFEVRELDWKQLEALVAEHAGKVVVVDIWSTACEPCLREFPRLVALQQRHPNEVVCVSFDCDFAGIKNKPVGYYRERVLKALTNLHAGNLINIMSTVPADELFPQLDLDSIPAVYVFDRDGNLAKRFDNRTPAGNGEGISYETQIDPLVAKLVAPTK